MLRLINTVLPYKQDYFLRLDLLVAKEMKEGKSNHR